MMRKTLLSCTVLSLLCLISHTSGNNRFIAASVGQARWQHALAYLAMPCVHWVTCQTHLSCNALSLSTAVCIFGKTAVRDGETFPQNRCTFCTCTNGNLDCSEQTCPELHCYAHEYPEKLQEGDCCPVCIPKLIVEPAPYLHPSCNFEGEFTDPANPCLTCTCHNGRKACLDVAGACEPLECERTLVVEGQCCPQCAQPQEQSLPTSDCSEQTCPELLCYAHEYPEKLQEGDCCPVCVPKLQIEPLYPQSCRVNDNTVIQHGSSYPKDACTTCTCSNGILGCAREICPAPSCPRGQVPVRSRGECCERCSLPPTPKPTRCVQGSRRHNLDCSTCVCVDGGFVCHHDRVRCPYNLEPSKNDKQAIVGGSSQETGKDQILEMPRLRKARN